MMNMKQTVEEAAYNELLHSYSNPNNPYSEYGREAMINMFYKGVEWQADQSPWISVDKRLPERNGYYIVTDGYIFMVAYFFKEWNKFAGYKEYPHPFYEEGIIKLHMPIPSFNEILEANKDVLQRLKEKGD